MTNKQVAVFLGDDASPEVMRPTVDLLRGMDLGIDFVEPMVGQAAKQATGTLFPDAAKAQIDAADATFFGSTSGDSTPVLFYLRWGKQTYANLRPCVFTPGFSSPLAQPEGIDFAIVRENLEDLYLGLEGDIEDLAGLNLYSRHARANLGDLGPGKYAIKAITEKGSERVIRYAFELARQRDKQRKVTVTCKYNMLAVADGLFLEIGKAIASEYPDIEFEHFIVDDFLCRMISNPHALDVVVMPNLYGDIMSDGAAGLIGGLGLAPSGCYGEDYAYFESAHGTAPDIAGQNIINPTATLLSAAMLLDYVGQGPAATRLRHAVTLVYQDKSNLTADQGGSAGTSDFFRALTKALETV
ncbi:MAG: isocitrate/isopropylmalate dehydrogenase family protein [Proteobacteria bacterium]|nr:isocitrate/isopropylmalate dehydrogenase family protein [Pseudomonadota bacterium]